jgi:hypothetical protein
MNGCDKAVGEQTIGDIAGCAWSVTRDAVLGVVSHPGGANVTQWIVTICAFLIVVIVLGRLLRI